MQEDKFLDIIEKAHTIDYEIIGRQKIIEQEEIYKNIKEEIKEDKKDSKEGE